MSTMASPSCFAHYVISLCSDKVDKEHILHMVNSMIGEFWEGEFSRLSWFFFFLLFSCF
jgi:hypothetical protein